jgi:RNA polymerase-binding transcription factor DksA
MSEQEKTVQSLRKARERALFEIDRLKEDLQAEIEPASATDDDAAADAASDVYERSKIISLIQGHESKVRALESAIKAAEQGTYGICEMCGTAISPERLEIVPETTVCVQCAAKREQTFHRWQMAAEDTLAPRHRRRPETDEDEDDDDDDDDEEGAGEAEEEDDAEY